MQNEQIYAILTELFREVFNDSKLILSPSTTSIDIFGWDSLKMVLIIVAVQERFGINLRSRDVDQLKCVGDLVKAIESKID